MGGGIPRIVILIEAGIKSIDFIIQTSIDISSCQNAHQL